jgi:hypothetical protein
MTPSAKTIGRRELLGRGASVAALAVVGAAVPLIANASGDKVLSLISLYHRQVEACFGHDNTDDETDAIAAATFERTMVEICRTPATTAAGALAVLDLIFRDKLDLHCEQFYPDRQTIMLFGTIRDYIASTKSV